MEPSEAGFFASTSLARCWPVATSSSQATSFPTATSKEHDLPPKRSRRELTNPKKNSAVVLLKQGHAFWALLPGNARSPGDDGVGVATTCV